MARVNYPDYLQVNPLGTVPTLVDGGQRLTESAVIPYYLAQMYGGEQLLVRKDEADYGHFLNYMHHGESTLTFPQTVFLRYTTFQPDPQLKKAGEDYRDWFIARTRLAVETLQKADYICAQRFTIADISVAYAVQLAEALGFADLMDPLLIDYLTRLRKRPAYQRAQRAEQVEVEPVGQSLIDQS